MIHLNPVVNAHDNSSMQTVRDELARIQDALQKGYETPYGALNTVSDPEALSSVHLLVEKLQKFNPRMLLLAGIGGSNMGTVALLHALGKKNPIHFLCADTIDDRYTSSLLAQFRQVLHDGHNVILCMVTKSGTTPETIINGALFLEILKEFHPHDYHQYVVVITDNDSPLQVTAHKENFALLEIPKQVGGRYSVFTPVGLFPLMMLGIDVKGLRKGATRALRSCLDTSLEINDTAQNALSLYAHYKAGYEIHNLFVFSPYLVLLGHWYKQLIGESLGKQESTEGKLVEVGFTPLVSLGTTDLHSVTQLYLAGPRTMFTSFLYFEDEFSHLKIPSNSVSSLVSGISQRSLTEVKSAIVQGTINAYKKQKRPSLVIGLEQTAESLGAFLVQKMVETMLLGRLLDINAFDQPAVELYKEETREILKR